MNSLGGRAPLPNWSELLEAVCARDSGALRWGLPEQWVNAELFAEMNRRSSRSGWIPLPQEVPYVTHAPATLPRARDWRVEGAIKWVDLCLHSPARDAWYWLELKVRHAGLDDRKGQARTSGLDALKKDVAALAAFDPELTAQCWLDPDESTKIHWANRLLAPNAKSLRSATHKFAVLYLELCSDDDNIKWDKESVMTACGKWLAYRCSHLPNRAAFPAISFSTRRIGPESHSLTILDWQRRRTESSPAS